MEPTLVNIPLPVKCLSRISMRNMTVSEPRHYFMPVTLIMESFWFWLSSFSQLFVISSRRRLNHCFCVGRQPLEPKFTLFAHLDAIYHQVSHIVPTTVTSIYRVDQKQAYITRYALYKTKTFYYINMHLIILYCLLSFISQVLKLSTINILTLIEPFQNTGTQ